MSTRGKSEISLSDFALESAFGKFGSNQVQVQTMNYSVMFYCRIVLESPGSS